MHPPEARAEALRLVEAGINDCEISRRLGIPRSTVRDWRRPTYVPRRRVSLETCPRCWRAAKPMRFTAEDYAELLGLYLGDGYISQAKRTHRLRISLDAKYPGIIRKARDLLDRCFPENSIDVITKHVTGKCVNLSVYSKHLKCLFPQHGPGKKHERSMALEPWQLDVLKAAPWGFIRGSIRSDGCCFINRTGPYEYLSYDFANMSKDIVDLFLTACEMVGIGDYRLTRKSNGLWDVRINRRESVALMLQHVGRKA